MSKKATSKAKPKSKAPASHGSSGGRSNFWPGLLVGGALAAAAVHYGPGLYKEFTTDVPGETTEDATTPPKAKKVTDSKDKPVTASASVSAKPPAPSAAKPQVRPESTAPSRPQVAPAPNPSPAPPAAGPVFFRDPARAANLLVRLGMGESYPGSLLWKHTDALGWNAFGVSATSGGPVSTASVGNTVTCLIESKSATRVEAIRLTANLYQMKESEPTLAKFRQFAQAVLTETRCPGTREFLEAIDGRLGLQTTSADARFTLSQSALAPGTRWELTVEAR